MTHAEQLAIMRGPAYDDDPKGARVWEVLHDLEGRQAKRYAAAEAEWGAVAEALGIEDDPTSTSRISSSSTPESKPTVPTIEEQQAAELDRLGAAWEEWSTT